MTSTEMKCVHAAEFGTPRDVLQVAAAPRPEYAPGKEQMLIKVWACGLSPGDWRTLSGSVNVIRHPVFPYIPAGDVCGIVEEIDEDTEAFKVGDVVVATWDFIALGGLAEYAVVDTKYACLKPQALSPVEAAGMVNSGAHALMALDLASVKPSERVLVLGGSGGVGTFLLQLLKANGVEFVACTSSAGPDLLTPLGADQVIDYTSDNWWEVPEFRKKKFDVIFDCAEGRQAWKHCAAVLKTGWNGGRFIAVCSDSHEFSLHHWWQLLTFMVPPLGRTAWTRLFSPFTPQYKMKLGPSITSDLLKQLFDFAVKGKIKCVLDPQSPFDFTTEGVVAAFDLQRKRRAHGKIVIKILDE